MKFKLFLLIGLLLSQFSFSQQLDSLSNNDRPLSAKHIAVPAFLIVLGLTQVGHETKEMQASLQKDFPSFKTSLDDFIQYVPLSANLLMGNALGLKPQHTFRARFIYSAISYGMMSITVTALKNTIHETRPDGTTNNSFPSGHSAFAFTGAELFHQELKKSHPVLSYAAFPIAASVSVCRVLNNRHYVSDVLVGAGIGILSAKAAYAIYHPKENQVNKFSMNITPTQIMGKNGISLSCQF